MKILLVFGTRPEAIKMASLIYELKKHSNFNVRVCVTGQHRDMLDQVLNLFNIIPDIDLNIMESSQDLTSITCNILTKLKHVIFEEKPDLVLVHGDTTTTFAASLSAFYHKVKVGHIEAGLRTGNIDSPWPEEANRKLVSSLACLHFTPTATARNNLISENINSDTIFVTGNTVIDSLLEMKSIIGKNINLQTRFDYEFSFINKYKKSILITGHRRENFGQGFQNICHAIKLLAQKNQDVCFIYPVHLNPNVKNVVEKTLYGQNNIYLISPQTYDSFVYLMSRAYIILTDSGGIQEEAPSLGKPVLVMRNSTERPEAISAGTVKLVGTSTDEIYSSVTKLLNNANLYLEMSKSCNPYGDGKASKYIAKILLKNFIN
ncbi:UDP-N-acetyl glucosamine-2-epimerase [Xenorhabdus nematophila ATCC 19061]|uniref:UDP-N-acetylglucosamine 2-epimerase n=1 Tax=Xenorhabdus nematophila (strain ATCC 19061 / DSM 3370 / CCUG 14189 / LMG 1036 / NCIMB 9965 / AN6) TaxID=406817 RepID=D3VGB4_XENNA|nr:UDP-N-acetylglucosamine 2-epimerase (non-hydrolyzing) [Xenorhabdus nematophila]CBJ88204.1 UDP-N-acetyl glucosamine-2-epimerase [Xenorhabdus nematophila ATCC 19061]CEK21122.1 UDP-N-acetyl glucosamine-2-epimerase [Xenorhabdus nematophila AN6/1]